ncbi:AMP-dependent synthetase/ligase [Sciscionella marina]|uniref:AMP-dependent synthetase/ligase n=1 Tax=Sciscionella marina TaxID=508770 RepID=UPI00037E30A4|nr:AMP-dependent synthetase/ligase [Sciscionella marina]
MDSSTTLISGPDLEGPPLEAETVPEAFQRIVRQRPDRLALRNIDGSVALTWRELAARVEKVAAGLAAHGLEHGDALALVLPNSIECHIVDYAAAHIGAVPFAVFNSSPAVQIAHQLRNSDAKIVFTNQEFRQKVLEAVDSQDVTVRRVVVVDGEADERTCHVADIEGSGAAEFDFESAWRSIKPDDLATLIYTSGTTGPPKGAEWSHRGVMCNQRSLAAGLPIPRESLVSFLPLAHAGGRVTVHYMALMHGATITECPDMALLPRALAAAHPDAFFSVPRLWEKLRVAVEGLVEAESDPQLQERMRRVIDRGMRWARACERGSGVSEQDVAKMAAEHQEDLHLLRPLLGRVGLDNVVSAFVGGAPAGRELSLFFRAVGIPMLDAYGSTEASLVLFNQIDNFKTATVGRPLPGVEARVAQDGELLLRSDSTFLGYRKQEDAAREVLEPDGWLHTGDIAAIDEDGFVSIVDRKKEIIINSAGKNMSPATIESAVKDQSSLIDQVVAIGDGRRYVTALITVDPEAAATEAYRLGLEGKAYEEVVASPRMCAEVSEAVQRANETLNRNEQIKDFVLIRSVWSPGGDELTPTGKIRRREVQSKYAEQIKNLYA